MRKLTWTVVFSRSAKKQYEKFKRNGSRRPSVVDVIDLLAINLKMKGPHLIDWPKYGPLERNVFHCHLLRGKPTYVACWRMTSKTKKEIEVYYVGTHEKAPY